MTASARRLSVGLLALFAAPAAAADKGPLDRIPAKVPVLVHLRGLDGVKGRLLSAVANVLPGEDGRQLTGFVKGLIGQAADAGPLRGRKWKGTPTDGPVFAVLTDWPDNLAELPPLALVVKVDDYAAFRTGLLTAGERADLEQQGGVQTTNLFDRPVFLAEADGYAVVSTDKAFAAAFARGTGGFADKLPKGAGERLLAADLAVYVDLAGANKAFGEQLLEFRRMAEAGTAREAKAKGFEPEAIEAMKLMFAGAYQAVRDSRGLLVTAAASDDGLRVHAEAAVAPDSKTGRVLAKDTPAPLAEVGRLPAAYRSFAAVRPAAAAIFKPLLRAMTGDLTGGADPLVTKALALQDEAGVTAQSAAHQDRNDLEGLTVYEAADPGKLVAGQVGLFRGLKAGAAFNNWVLKEKAEVTENAQQHRGFALHRVRVPLDLEKMAAAGQSEVEVVRREAGGDEAQMWFGTDGKVAVELRGPNWRTARGGLDEYLDGRRPVGTAKGFAAARGRLPGAVSLLYMEDSTLYSQAMVDGLAAQSGKKGGRVPRPGAGQAVYAGLSVTLAAGRIEADLWVPLRVWTDYFQAVLPAGRDQSR